MTSLRGKILLLLAGTVLTITVLIAIISQHGITQTVSERESLAVHNTVELVSLNITTRWSHLLDEKIRAVRNERARLMEGGALVYSVLEAYAWEAQNGLLTQDQAQAIAQTWINRLSFENRRKVWIYGQDNRIVSSTDSSLIGRDISGLLDFKGRPLAETMREEGRDFGYGFVVYNFLGADGEGTRFAHFRYFGPWDWIVTVSDSTKAITEQNDSKQAELVKEMRDILSPLVLAQSGFVFIIADDGRFIVPPPEAYLSLFEVKEGDSDSLAAVVRLHEESRAENALASRVFHFRTGKESWRGEYVHIRPLAWTLVALVPETDLILPARQLLDRQAAISTVILCLSLLCAFFLAARIVQPLTQLTGFARVLPEQDFLSSESRVPAHIAALPGRSHDEIGHLAAAFLFMDRRLRENILRLVRETTTRERIESELDIARSIQLGLLPDPLELSPHPSLSLKAVMLPAKEVGGDLYDYFMLSDRALCFVIGDVSGKGVPAALFMAITRTLVRSAGRNASDPSQMIQIINDRLSETNPKLMFTTLFLGVLDLDTGELDYVNAGHPPPILITREGRAVKLEGRGGPACGVMKNLPYRSFSVHLDSGDTLLGYTDGVTEAVDGEGTQYGEARLLDILAHPVKEAEEATARLLADVENFTAGTEPFDDITLIAVRLS